MAVRARDLLLSQGAAGTGRRCAITRVGWLCVLLCCAPGQVAALGGGPLRWNREQQLKGVAVPVFHPESARKTAQIRVARIVGEYGKSGVLRVAWRREAVFDGLELEVLDSSDWPRIAAAVRETVRRLGRADLVRIRSFVLRQDDGAALTVAAESASLSAAGELVLREVAITGAAGTERRREWVLRLDGAVADLGALLPMPAAKP